MCEYTRFNFALSICCLVGADGPFQLVGGGLLRVHLLLRHRSRIIQQTLEALVVQLRVLQLGLIAEQVGLRLIERHLERPGIDDRQQVSLIDVLAFFEIDLRQLSIHPALYADRVGGGHAAQAFQIHRDVATLGGGDRHGHHDLGRGPRRARFGAGTAAGQDDGRHASRSKSQKAVGEMTCWFVVGGAAPRLARASGRQSRMLTQSLPRMPLGLFAAQNRSHIDARNYIPVATYLPLLQDFTFPGRSRFRPGLAAREASRIRADLEA